MKYITIGAAVLLVVCIFGFGDRRGMDSAIMGVLAMYLMACWARYCEQRDERKKAAKRAAIFSGIAFFVGQAKAIFLFIAIAIGIGLILWGGIKLWSAALSIHPMLQRNNVAAVSVAAPPVVAASPRVPYFQPPCGLDALFLPTKGGVEWSADTVNWYAWDGKNQPAAWFWRERR